LHSERGIACPHGTIFMRDRRAKQQLPRCQAKSMRRLHMLERVRRADR
jgi:hypothetical protein